MVLSGFEVFMLFVCIILFVVDVYLWFRWGFNVSGLSFGDDFFG